MRRLFTSAALLIGGATLAATVVSSCTPAAATAAVGSTAAASRSREVTVPAGTVLHLRLKTAVGSDLSRPEDPVSAKLDAPLTWGGVDVLPAGSEADGYVTTAERPGKVKGRGRVGMRFSTIVSASDHERYDVATRNWVAVAPATKKKNAMTIGIPAAGGAIVGALIGGGKGAGIGALAGGGAGTAVVLSTRGKDVRIGRGAAIDVRLAAPATFRVAG